ncbi:hypothetical protein RIF29_08951 [Crotalaria pallida]|uniref:Protein FAR1-RELATED SEQUENCE n=1 Tax=Crotalaria pallida TaxID=3830 RepID=A0AAN9FRB5_CROPI
MRDSGERRRPRGVTFCGKGTTDHILSMDGRSLLDCQKQVMRLDSKERAAIENRSTSVWKEENEYTCSVCEPDSSSNNVGNPPIETDLGEGVNEVEDDMECEDDIECEDDMEWEEDVALNGDDMYQIDGMDDIGPKAGKMKVIGCKETTSYMIYTVAYYRNGRKAWRVSYDADSLQIKCCCQRFESQGIPCAHIFVVIFFFDIGELPKCVIMGRWTKMAKQGHGLGAIEKGNWMGDNLVYSRLGGLMSCCRRLCNLASRNADDYKSVREKVCNEIMLLEGKYDESGGCSSQGNCSGIMDPTPLKRRGGGR